MFFKNRYKIIIDFIYSIISSLIVVGITQLLVYPYMARIMDADEYGMLLTIMGIVNTFSAALGNTLNNTRLIQDTKYNEKRITGDYNILLLFSNVIGFLSILFISIIYFEKNINTSILLAFLTALSLTKSYLLVGYRININYRLNFFCHLASCIGYAIGIIIVHMSKIWALAFIISEMISIAFVIFTSRLHKEPLKITMLMRETSIKYVFLIATGLFGNLLVYFDRFIIYPILGGESVSIYSTASLFGKSLGLLITPIAGVLLSYFSQKNYIMTKKLFWTINIIVFIISFIFFALSLFIAPWLTKLLYPAFAENANKYITVANIAAIINVASMIIQPSILKFAPTYWQVLKEIIYGVIYFCIGITLLKSYGIFGFCCATIIANSARLALLCLIGFIYIK